MIVQIFLMSYGVKFMILKNIKEHIQKQRIAKKRDTYKGKIKTTQNNKG